MERKIPSGIFQIKNTVTGRMFLGSSLNLDGSLNSQTFRLSCGAHSNQELQKGRKALGAENVVVQILEVEQVNEINSNFISWHKLELTKMIWMESLQPFFLVSRASARDPKFGWRR